MRIRILGSLLLVRCLAVRGEEHVDVEPSLGKCEAKWKDADAGLKRCESMSFESATKHKAFVGEMETRLRDAGAAVQALKTQLESAQTQLAAKTKAVDEMAKKAVEDKVAIDKLTVTTTTCQKAEEEWKKSANAERASANAARETCEKEKVALDLKLKTVNESANMCDMRLTSLGKSSEQLRAATKKMESETARLAAENKNLQSELESANKVLFNKTKATNIYKSLIVIGKAMYRQMETRVRSIIGDDTIDHAVATTKIYSHMTYHKASDVLHPVTSKVSKVYKSHVSPIYYSVIHPTVTLPTISLTKSLYGTYKPKAVSVGTRMLKAIDSSTERAVKNLSKFEPTIATDIIPSKFADRICAIAYLGVIVMILNYVFSACWGAIMPGGSSTKKSRKHSSSSASKTKTAVKSKMPEPVKETSKPIQPHPSIPQKRPTIVKK